MLRLMVVDDQEIVRTGLRHVFETEPGITVVGEAADGREALSLIPEVRPDVVVMDIAMPGLDGIVTTAELTRTAPEISVVVLTLHDDDDTRARAMAAGAVAFVAKHQMGPALLAAVRQVAGRHDER